MSNIQIIKKASILKFKRFFELTSYILLLPKIFIKHLKNITYLNCLNYYFKYSYPFFSTYNFSNLICISSLTKISFLKILNTYYNKYFSFKFKNLYFNTFSSIFFNFLSTINVKKFILKLKYFLFYFIKYIYTFNRYFN
jgi:hypothetical protein